MNHYRNLYYGCLIAFTFFVSGTLILGEYHKGNLMGAYLLAFLSFIVVLIEFGCYETLARGERQLADKVLEAKRDMIAQSRTPEEQKRVDDDRESRSELPSVTD